MSAEPSRSDRPSYSDTPETPGGIYLIAVLGLIGAILAVPVALDALTTADGSVVLGIVVLAVAIAQAITMLALVGLTPWAWYATVVLYTVSAGLSFVEGKAVGVLIGLVIAGYVFAHKDLFETA